MVSSKVKFLLVSTIIWSNSSAAGFYGSIGSGVQLGTDSKTPVVLNGGVGYNLDKNFSVGVRGSTTFIPSGSGNAESTSTSTGSVSREPIAINLENGSQDDSIEYSYALYFDAKTDGDVYGFGSIGYGTVSVNDVNNSGAILGAGIGLKDNSYIDSGALEFEYMRFPDVNEEKNHYLGISYKFDML